MTNRSSSRNWYSPYRCSFFRSPWVSWSRDNSFSRYLYRNRGFNCNRKASRPKFINVFKQRRDSTSPNVFLPGITITVIFLQLTLGIDKISVIDFDHIDFHQGEVQDLHMHPEDLVILYNQIPLQIETTKLNTFRKSKDKIQVIMFTTELTNAIISTDWFL